MWSLDWSPILCHGVRNRETQNKIMNFIWRRANDLQTKIEFVITADSAVDVRLHGSAENLSAYRFTRTISGFLDQLRYTIACLLEQPIALLSLQAQLIVIVRQEMPTVGAFAGRQPVTCLI